MMKRLWKAAAAAGLVLSLGACGDKVEDNGAEEHAAPPAENGQQDTGKSPKESVNENIDKSDTEMTDGAIKKEMEEENGVNEAKLSINEDEDSHVIADMTVNEAIDEEKANELAEKYADKLKEKYKDHSIDVQVRKHGDIIGKASLDKEE